MKGLKEITPPPLPMKHPGNRECPNGELVRKPYNSYHHLCCQPQCGYCGPRLAREMASLIFEAEPTHHVAIGLEEIPTEERAAKIQVFMKAIAKQDRSVTSWARIDDLNDTAEVLLRGGGAAVQAVLLAAPTVGVVPENLQEVTDRTVTAFLLLEELIAGIGMSYQRAAEVMEHAIGVHTLGEEPPGAGFALTQGMFWRRRGRDGSWKDANLRQARSWIRAEGWRESGPASIRWRTVQEEEAGGSRWNPRTRRYEWIA